MRNLVSTYVDQFRQDRQKQIKLAAVLAALAVIVAGVVFWQLHSTGVAMTNEVFCGQEEHVHDDSCYEQVLVCGLDESASVEGHVHSDACYETVETLACQDESEEHVHTEECYVTEQNLVCGLEEAEGTEGHVHSDACYETVLTCEIPEHTHTIECMNDEEADVETAEDWEATLPEELSGVWAQDVVSIAESQIGYTESERNFQLADDGETRQGYTRYGAWYGNEYGDWDAMFASFCLNYAGVPEDEFPEASGVYAWVTELGNAGMYVPADKFTPQAGDLAFFDLDEDGQADSVGVISYLSSKDIYVIEGNYEDAVTEQTYDLNDNQIIGYGILPDQPGVEVEPVTLIQQTLKATIYSDASCVQTLAAAESITLSGMMPENASVIAYPVDVTIGDMTILAAYDITIYDENGHEFEPEDENIQVSISNSEIRSALGNNKEPVVYHINDRTDILEEVSKVSTSNGMIEFAAESFSIYIVGENDGGYYHPGNKKDPITVYTFNFYDYEYDSNEEAVLMSTQYIAEDGIPEEPATPEIANHHFVGWYTEKQSEDGEEVGYLYDFSKTVKANVDDWGEGYLEDHEINLYSDFDIVYFVYYEYYMEAEDGEGIVWFDEYTEEYPLNGSFELDTSSVDSILQVKLGDQEAVTGWYSKAPYYNTETHEFEWDDSSKVENGTPVNEDMVLYPKVEEVIWIYFTLGEDEDEDVEAADPTYVLGSADTLEGVLPGETGENSVSRPGYELEGWYALVNGTYVKVSENSNPQELLKSEEEHWIDLYANWTPTNVSYTVNIWRQKATDGQIGLDQKVVQDEEKYSTYIQYYDYAESITVNAEDSLLKTGDTDLTYQDFGSYTTTTGTGPNQRTTTVYYWNDWTGYGWTDSSDGTGNYEGFEYNETRTENDLATITVKADGSTIINIFYDRVTVTYHFGTSTNANSTGTLIGLYDTNITPTNGSNAGGTLSAWPSAGNSAQWHFQTSRTGYTIMTFLAKFSLEDTNYSYRSNEVYFTTTSASGTATLYYYLEVTDPDRQVTSSSTTRTMSNGKIYVLEQTVSIAPINLTFSDKYIGYKYVGYATNSTTTTISSGTSSQVSNGGSLYIFNDALEYEIELYSNHNGEQLVWSNEYKYGEPLSMDDLPTDLDPEEYGPASYYHFLKWCEDPTLAADFVLPDTMPANNLVAYADWEVNTITVTFTSRIYSNLYDELAGLYGAENVTDNGYSDEYGYSYSITMEAGNKLKYSLDNGLEAEELEDDPNYDPDDYTFTAWLNSDTGKVFNFENVLTTDTTIEAMWAEEESLYQIIYVINLDDSEYSGVKYVLGNLHGNEGDAEVRMVENEFYASLCTDSDQFSKFVCWNTKQNGEGINYYPDSEIIWDDIDWYDGSDNVIIDGNHHYYILYAKWATENEAVLHVDYNYPGGDVDEGVEYDDAYITVSNLGEFDLSENDVEDGYYALNEGDEITINGVTYRFAGWSTYAKEEDETYTKDDVNIQADATVAVDNVDTDENGINTIYAVWLAELQFTIEKTDTTSVEALDGAVFTLSYTDAENTTYYYTLINGNYVWVEADDSTNPPTVTLGNIRFHDTEGEFTGDEEFTLTEITAPEGYLELGGSITFSWDVDANEVVIDQNVNGRDGNPLAVADGGVLTVMNEAEFAVDVYKVDENEEPLSWVDFYLTRVAANGSYERAVFSHSWNPNTYYLEDWFNPDEEWLNGFTIETNSNGYFRIEWLEPGTYTLYEVTTNLGYVLPNEGIEFTVNEDGSITSDWWDEELEGLQIENELESFSVYKIDDEGNPLEGAKFVLGEIWENIPTTSTQIGNSDWVYDFLILDQNNDGEYVYNGSTDDMSIATEVVTDSNGLINVSGVPTRQYYFLVETEAPAGYAKLEEYIIFYVNEYGEITLYSEDEHVSTDGSTILVTDDDSIFDVLIYKYDPDRYRENYLSTDVEVYDVTNYSLEGAEFILSRSVTGGNDEVEYAVAEYDSNIEAYTVTSWTTIKNEATTFKSSSSGYVWIFNLEADTYTLTETKAPDNYELLTESIVFTVNSEGSVTVTEESPAVIDNGRICIANTEITGAFELDKTDVSGNSLSGAEFIMGYFGKTTTSTYNLTEDEDYYYYYAKFDDSSGAYVFSGDTDYRDKATILTTDENGIINIENLFVSDAYEVGYFLIETKAPDGYNLLEDPIVFKVADDGTIQIAVDNIYASMSADGTVMTVENVAGSELPHTGGIGTWIYTIAGILLIGGAATLLVYRKRRAV